jgi:hypothetical protein
VARWVFQELHATYDPSLAQISHGLRRLAPAAP